MRLAGGAFAGGGILSAIDTAEASSTTQAGDFETVVVPAGEQRQFTLGSGETLANLLIDITADGADAQVVADGDDWTIRNVGFKGRMDLGSNNGGLSNCIKPRGNGLIDHVYMGDGTYDGVRSGGIGLPSSHSGHIEVRNSHVAEWTDNGLYNANAADNGGGTVHVDNCYFRDNNVAHLRIAADGTVAENSVLHNTGNTPALPGGAVDATGVYTGYGDENQVVEIRNCQIDCRQDNSNSEAFWARDGETWVDVYDTQFAGGTIGNVRLVSGNGSDPDLSPPTGVPMTAEEAASGGSSSGTDGEPPSDGDGGGSSDTDVAVSTGEATDVGDTSSTLGGSLGNLGGADSVDVAFEYRTAGADDWTTTDAETLDAPGNYSRDVTGLAAETEYEFRATAAASDGDTDAGDATSFSTDTTGTSDEHHLVIRTFDGSGVDYQFRTTGAVRGGDTAEPVDNNDSITENDDGTYTVEGETGNGYTDDWYFAGEITEWSAEQHPDVSSGEYELVLDGSVVTPEELTGSAEESHLVIRTFDGSGVEYQFRTSGPVEGGDTAEPVDNNDSITENGDGTYTVEGETGNGYTDDWYFTGDITEWSAEQHPDVSSGEYELVLDGTVVTPEELTGTAGSDESSLAVSTADASNVEETAATLSGALDDLGGADSADVAFEYRASGTDEWTTTDSETLDSSGAYTREVTGLTAETEYEFRATAESDDAVTGSSVGFTTAAASADGPVVDRFAATDSGSSDSGAEFTVEWAVSDPTRDLQRIRVDVVDGDGSTVDSSEASDAGRTAWNVEQFRIDGVDASSLTAVLTVEDEAGNQTTEELAVTG